MLLHILKICNYLNLLFFIFSSETKRAMIPYTFLLLALNHYSYTASAECNREFELTGKNCDSEVDMTQIKYFSEKYAMRMNGYIFSAIYHLA